MTPTLWQNDKENPILILYLPPILSTVPAHTAISLAGRSKSDVLSTGTVRALFQGFPMHLPIAIGVQGLIFKMGQDSPISPPKISMIAI